MLKQKVEQVETVIGDSALSHYRALITASVQEYQLCDLGIAQVLQHNDRV